MANYFIGDIQGCFDEFHLLLKKIKFNPQSDHLYLVGDLIGRGPQALETLDFLLLHKHSIHPVLGNHDLHFLAISQGIKSPKANDKYDKLLASSKLSDYVNYLRSLPLLIDLPHLNIIVSHAGISPQWDASTAKTQAKDVENILLGSEYQSLLSAMYNNSINDWTTCHSQMEKAIYTINSLTRMRYCYHDSTLNFSQNCTPTENTNQKLIPWFQFHSPDMIKQQLVFGHWAALMGVTNNKKILALDTGCLWGNWLTAWCVETNTLFEQKSLQ